MPQLHLYVSKDIASKIKKRAENRGMTVSRYLAELVHNDISVEWPEYFFDEIVGGWRGEPLVRPEQGELEKRDEL